MIDHVVSLFGLKILNINNQEKAFNFWTHLIYKLFLFYFHANLEAFKRCLKLCLEKLWRYMWREQTKYLTAWKRPGRCPGWNRRSLYRRSEAGPLSWVHSSCLRLKLEQRQISSCQWHQPGWCPPAGRDQELEEWPLSAAVKGSPKGEGGADIEKNLWQNSS